MASESGGKKSASFSSMKQPPLTKQLSKLLSEYPDGQIIKELLQNAEDAGATRVEVVCDERVIEYDRHYDGKEDYRKFFEGPALCVYNDAQFTEEDWEGIRMLDSSVKEDDRLKVGRFGQGFKSVFHLTDYPCIISGETILLIDPQQQRDRVNAMMELRSLPDYEGIDMATFFKAFDGTFQITRDLISRGKFPGTLFRFPLRKKPSDLSSNLYTTGRIRELFDVFESEASSILLFLRSLESISLHERTTKGKTIRLADVKIANIDSIRKKRETFNALVNSLPKSYSGSPVQCPLILVIECTSFHRHKNTETRVWNVVNYFMGGNVSPEFKSLIEDPELQLSPYVGIAAPIDQSAEVFSGHVFCFLPLPKEGMKLTGLPVHVNGFFALSQNRHHLKWATDEQIGHTIGEKAIRWNEKLIQEAVPLAYKTWFEKAIECSHNNANKVEIVRNVHCAFPDVQLVQQNWSAMLHPLFRQLASVKMLFSVTKQWVHVQHAYLIDEDAFSKANYLESVTKAAQLLDIDCVVLNNSSYRALSNCRDIQAALFTPSILGNRLRKTNIFPSLNDSEKLHVLEFLLTDKNVRVLEQLPLLPLQSGGWTHFLSSLSYSASFVYMASSERLALFPGMEDKFIRRTPRLPNVVEDQLKVLCQNGAFQLRILDSNDVETLLGSLMQTMFPGSTKKQFKTSCLSVQWLKDVWQYLLQTNSVSICQRVPLFPLMKGGNSRWNNPDAVLICLTEKVLLKEHGRIKLPEEVFCCLDALGIDVICSFPPWIPSSCIEHLVQRPSPQSVSVVLNCIAKTAEAQEKINSFNSCKETNRLVFMQYMSSIRHCCKLLSCFKMFQERSSYNGKPKMKSVQENVNFTAVRGFPVRYPVPCMDGYQKDERDLLLTLGCKEIVLHEMFKHSFNQVKKQAYSQSDVKVLMQFFVSQYRNLQYTALNHFPALVQMAKEIPFLPCSNSLKKTSQLFNPFVPQLQELFNGQTGVFPEFTTQPDKETISILLELGLKGIRDVTASDLLQIARLLDQWDRSSKPPDQIIRKSRALLKHLDSNPEVLRYRCEGQELKLLLENLHIVEYERNRPPSYPSWMPWFTQRDRLCKPKEVKSTSFQFLVGSLLPTVAFSFPELDSVFGWRSAPKASQVALQLTNVSKNHSGKGSKDLLVSLGHLYEWFGQYNEDFSQLQNEAIIWNGANFSRPAYTIIHKNRGDVTLKPFFDFIPDTFSEYAKFFEKIGCHLHQSIPLLIQTLQLIRNHENARQFEDLALNVVERLAQRRGEIQQEILADIFIPLRRENVDKLMFKPIPDCTYTENPENYFEDEVDMPVFFVHERISEEVANALSIKSLLKTRLCETEELGIEEWGQEESLTDRIKSLLEGYRDGLSIPKELIQNADDSGATTIEFVYDERENANSRQTLLHPGMKICQGPALWVFNNAKFSEEDFRNIIKLNGATKRDNSTKIGKFGLGFCSVYNLTDVPSFISGSNIVMFDPQKTHLVDALPNNSPGMKIDLKRPRNRALVQKHKNQFMPFNDMFGCNIFQKNVDFNGTLFRFPLRTFEESLSSSMCSVSYSKKEMTDLLQMFYSTAGSLLLFVQNIETVKVYHLAAKAASPAEKCLLFSVSRKCHEWKNGLFTPTPGNILSKVSNNIEHFSCLQQIRIDISTKPDCGNILPVCVDVPREISVAWLLSWAVGTQESMHLSKIFRDKRTALPLSAIAVPVRIESFNPMALEHPLCVHNFYRTGHLFCFLPMPIETDLCFHLHGCFEISSDRRKLLALTEDDKGSRGGSWNECLLEDASVNAFIDLLLLLSHHTDENYSFYQLWPTGASVAQLCFKQNFYRQLARNDKCALFKGLRGWASFQDIVFLDNTIRDNEIIGDIANVMAARHYEPLKKTYIDLPKAFHHEIKENNPDMLDNIRKKVITDTVLVDILLDTLKDKFWDGKVEDRDKMLVYMLERNDESILQKLKESECIPCEESGKLCLPRNLVHPKCGISTLFHASDGRFPSRLFWSKNILEHLMKLGMMKEYISEGILLERCKSVPELSSICCQCALIRIRTLLRYLSQDTVQKKLADEKTIIDEIRTNIKFLPVFPCPDSWPFPWFADRCDFLIHFKTGNCQHGCKESEASMSLSTPASLFLQNDLDLVGTVELIINEDALNQNPYKLNIKAFSFLRVKSRNDSSHIFSKVIEQLCRITDAYCRQNNSYDSVKEKMEKIYGYLQDIVSGNQNADDMDHYEECLKVLQERKVVLIGKALLKPSQVAFNVPEECFPYLNQLSWYEKLYREKIYKLIGVKEAFSSDYVIKVILAERKQSWAGQKCDEVDKIVKLLKSLHGIMQTNQETYDQFTEMKEFIVAPDVNCVLRPTCNLIIDDSAYVARPNMFILHDSVPIQHALALGVKTKRKRIASMISKGIPFGQKEDLVIRLKGLLKAYPRDESVLKELLQNADDAEATELHFIKDYRTHSSEGILINKDFQGPSLCVFNNSYFTENDLEGIHNLGYGSKRFDFTKTGQYGVGFNAVYHLTDTPSFISKGPTLDNGGVLCIFDPTCNNIEETDKTEPGMRYDINDVKLDFPCELLGFSEDVFFGTETGTMFRFPLRRKQSTLCDEIIEPKDVDNMLKSFLIEIKEALLFLKNIKTIKISDITTGVLQMEYCVSSSISEDDIRKKTKFVEYVNCWGHQAMDMASSCFSQQSEVQYVETICDSRGFRMPWVIVQKLGASLYPETIKESLRNKTLCHLPVGGVALPLKDYEAIASAAADRQTKDEPTCTFIGKAFAVLPLPIKTGLPAHVNGHFSLDHESRRDLWKEGLRLQWNKFLSQSVIVPCLVAAISFFKQYFIPNNKNCIHLSSWKQVHTLMDIYHSLFPVKNRGTDEFWKALVSDFYKYVYKKECMLFPVIDKNLKTEWVQLHSRSRKYCAVFNTICYLPNKGKYIIENVLKALGMQLVQTPKHVFETIRESGVKGIFKSDPSFVITYLSSFQEEEEAGRCTIGEIGGHISGTNFRDHSNLKELVAYIAQDKDFCTRITGLPIILTADGKVHICSEETPVYHSKFWSLLPNSGNMFLHEIMLPIFHQKELFDAGLLKVLDTQAFLSMLPASVPELHTSINLSWNKDSGIPVEACWLLGLYKFLYAQCLENTTHGTQHFHSQLFCTNFQHFEGYAVVPSKKKRGLSDVFELISADKAFSVFYPTVLEQSIDNIIQRLKIPLLDNSVFYEEDERHSELIRAIKYCITTTESPCKLLQCLLQYREQLLSNISDAEALELLNYFDRHLDDLKKANDPELQRKIKLLPLFITYRNSVVSVINQAEVIVIDENFPHDGIDHWTSSAQTVILRFSAKVEKVYRYLELEPINIFQLYRNYILPSLNTVPFDHRLVHIEFVKNALLRPQSSGCYSQSQMELIHVLKQIPFICVCGHKKRANQLYDYDLPLFQCMLNESSFPPIPFRSREWKCFLLLLGLNTEVNESQILEFARDIETDSNHTINGAIVKKSELILQSFKELCLCNKISDLTLRHLKIVRFIFPREVRREGIELWRQYDDGHRLIAFENSVISSREILCWTSMNILPPCAETSSKIMSKLGVNNQPPVDRVILHCQNISEPLKERVRSRNIDSCFVHSLLKKMYDFLLENLQSHEDMIKTRLKHTPFIYIPDENIIVKGSCIITGARFHDEIKPYLYKAPVQFWQYHELFTAVGAQEKVTCDHYISVLAQLKQKVQDEELVPQELEDATSAIQYLLIMIDSNNTIEISAHTLFLLNKSKKLVNSRDLVACDNHSILERIENANLNLNLFIGIRELGIPITDPKRCLSILPERLQPKFLTDIIKEEILLDSLITDEFCTLSMHIEDFVHSEEFLEGVLRILHHFNHEIIDSFDQALRENLQRVRIRRAHGLQTACYYNGIAIDGSVQDKLCFIQEHVNGDNTFSLYFQADNSDNILDIILDKDGLITLIEKLTETYFISSRLLTRILNQHASPDAIRSLLDREEITQYHLIGGRQYSVFPIPGTYVEERFHPFLEYGIFPFDKQEYRCVALELEDEMIDNEGRNDVEQEPVFIYVHILREENVASVGEGELFRRYLVNTGDISQEPVVVPIYRLYRFVRRRMALGVEMERFDQQPIQSFSFDENCRRIESMLKEAWTLPEQDRKRVVKRLMLKWHPDKNPDDRDYCNSVFQFIMSVTEHLQSEGADTIDGRQTYHSPSPYERMSANINRRASAYARAYQSNIDEYNRSNLTGPYAHRTREKRPDPAEARRWLQQAKNDIRAAELDFPRIGAVDGFNWTCYMCHQACEKALKAAHYSINANAFDRRTHSLSSLASALHNLILTDKALQLEDRLGEHTRMRYPDRLERRTIPSNNYSEADAEFSLEIVKEVIDIVDEMIT